MFMKVMQVYHPIMVLLILPFFTWNAWHSSEVKQYNLSFHPAINLITASNPNILPKFIRSPTELLSYWCSKSLKHVSMHLVLNICIVFCLNEIICVIKIELMLKYVAGWQLVPGIFLSYSICLWLYLKACSNAKGVIFQISKKLMRSCSLALGVDFCLLKQLNSYCSYIFSVQSNSFGTPQS